MDKSVVAKAVSSDESPTPGYVYSDIVAMTHANFEASRQLAAYLLERIKKPNHNVKFKCLQIIKHVCLKGRTDFKLSMQRESQKIKDCLTFSGPPDPLRGEEIYRKVREAAKEALDAVFSENAALGSGPQQRYASGNRIEGFGSSGPEPGAPGGPAGGYGYNGSGGGYGNGSAGYGNGVGNYPYDGYGGGNGGGNGRGFGEKQGSTSSIGAVGSAVGAVVGKAMGTLRGRASSSVAVGLVPTGGGYGGPDNNRSSGMVGMGNYDPSKDKSWLERTSESVKDSVGTGIASVHRQFSRGGSSMDARYQSHNGEPVPFSPSQYVTNRGPHAYHGGSGGGEGSYRAEAVTSAYEGAGNQSYESRWNSQSSSTPSPPPPSAPVINGGVRGVWGNSAPSSGQENSHSQPPGPPPAPYGHGSGVPGEQAGTGVREPVGRTGGGDSDGGYEGKLVEEICSAGGTKSTPGKQELDAFLSKATSLDPSKVASGLVAVLGVEDWRARSKALAVVEALHRSNPSYRIPLEDALNDPGQGVIPLCGDSKPAVRDRAVRVAKLLGLDVSSVTAGVSHGGASDDADGNGHGGYATAPDGEEEQDEQGTKATPSGQPVDLLGGDFDGGASAGGVDEAPTAVADILGVGTPQGASSNHEPDAVASSNDLLHGVDPGVPSRARGGAGFDDFLGLRESAPGAGESGTSGQAVTTPMADAGFSTGKGAFLSGENDGVEGSSSLFEDLSVKDGGAGVGDEGTQSSAAQPARVGNATGSGFSFMADGDEDPPAASEDAAGEGDLLSGFGGEVSSAAASRGAGKEAPDMLVMSPEGPQLEGGGAGRRKQAAIETTPGITTAATPAGAGAAADLLGLDPLAAMSTVTPKPVPHGANGQESGAASVPGSQPPGAGAASLLGLDSGNAGGVAGGISGGLLVGGGFARESGSGSAVDPAVLQLQMENQMLQQKYASADDDDDGARLRGNCLFQYLGPAVCQPVGFGIDAPLAPIPNTPPQVMMMQQGGRLGARTGGQTGVPSFPAVGGFPGNLPSMMRPQAGFIQGQQPLPGVMGTGTGGAGMMRPGGGKSIPDMGMWGAQSQLGTGAVAGLGVGVMSTQQHGQHQQQDQLGEEAPRAPDSFSFVRDAMDDLIK